LFFMVIYKAMEGYKVQLTGFEGPLELLLGLIEKRKLFINEISLAEVTDGYIAYLQNEEKFPLEQTANFLVVASTLLLIKSRSLLPSLSLTEEETEDIEELQERLRLYKDIKEKSLIIKERFGANIIFEGGLKKSMDPIFSPSKDITKVNLFNAIKSALANIPKVEDLPQAVLKKIVSLDEIINNLVKRIQGNLKTTFKTMLNLKDSSPEKIKEIKADIVVNFLAVLELVKRGIIMVNQNRDFEDIDIESLEYGVPRY